MIRVNSIALLVLAASSQAQTTSQADAEALAKVFDAANNVGLQTVTKAVKRFGFHKVKLAPGVIEIADVWMPEDEKGSSAEFAKTAFTKEGDWTQVDPFYAGVKFSSMLNADQLKAVYRETLDKLYGDPDQRSVGLAAGVLISTCFQVAEGKSLPGEETGRLAFYVNRGVQDLPAFASANSKDRQAIWESLTLITATVNVLAEEDKQNQVPAEKQLSKKVANILLRVMLG